jgi:hypothetical protein
MEIIQKSNESLVIAFRHRTLVSTLFAAALIGASVYLWWSAYRGASKFPLFSAQQFLSFTGAALANALLYLFVYYLLHQSINKLTLNAATQVLTVDKGNIFIATQKRYSFSKIKNLEWQPIREGQMLCLMLEGKKLELFGLRRTTIADRWEIKESIAAFNAFLETHKIAKENKN